MLLHHTLFSTFFFFLLQFAFVGTEALNIGTADTVQTVPNQSSLLQHTGVATFTLGDQGQQVYVITDPAQLEALQVYFISMIRTEIALVFLCLQNMAFENTVGKGEIARNKLPQV